MWLLHIVVVQGGGHFQLGIVLWLLTAAVGAGFALLAGEAARPDALLSDLAIAAGGGALLDAVTPSLGQDPVAVLFGVRVFWTVLGAFLALCLAHDAMRSRVGRRGRWPIGERGGFLFLFTWLSGWPSEPGIVEAVYDGGLGIKLVPASLHYQFRRGPLTAARTLPLRPGIVARVEGSALLVDEPAGRQTRLDGVRPQETLERLVQGLRQQVALAVVRGDAGQPL